MAETEDLPAEDAAAAALADITRRLHAMPMDAETRQQTFNRILLGLAAAGGLSRDGLSVRADTPPPAAEVNALADALGTQNPQIGKQTFLYDHPRPSCGSATAVLANDSENGGELMMLLVHSPSRNGTPSTWGCPGGYFNIIPPERTRPALPVLAEEYRHLLAEKDWRQAEDGITSGAAVRALLASKQVELGEGDINTDENWQRELREETGLKIASYPDARILPVRNDLSLHYSACGRADYTMLPRQLVILGPQAPLPELWPDDDVDQARWVPVRSIRKDSDGHYRAHLQDEALLIGDHLIPPLERTMQIWLNEQIRTSTAGKLESTEGMRAVLGEWTAQVLNGAEAGIDAKGRMPTLLGPEGTDRISAFLNASAEIANDPNLVYKGPQR